MFYIVCILGASLVFPVLVSAFEFEKATHKKASAKALFLLCFSLIPILFALVAGALWKNADVNILSEIISFREIFIYCASFLAPVFYIMHENNWNNHKFFWKPYTLTLFPILILLITGMCYAFNLLQEPSEQLHISVPIAIYLLTLSLWYLSILDGEMRPDEVHKKSLKDGAAKVAAGLDAKLKGRS